MGAVKLTILLSLFIAASCGISRELIYKDDWEGRYTLVEYNCCGDTATKVKIEIAREGVNIYNWKLFLGDQQQDVIVGKAFYEKNKLKFYVENKEVADKYFVKLVSKQSPVFWMEYHSQADYYTGWNTELAGYKRGKMLFAGIDYHFRRRTI